MNWLPYITTKTAQFDTQINNHIDPTVNTTLDPLTQSPDYNNWNTDPYLNLTEPQKNVHKLKPGKRRGISNKKNPMWRHAPNGAHIETDFGKTPNDNPLIKKDLSHPTFDNADSFNSMFESTPTPPSPNSVKF